jgi:putative ABC transport system ATP-binding protein
VTNAAPTTSEDLGRPAGGRLAARADAITKAYGSGDARVTALDERTRSTAAACWSATWT